VKRRSNSRPRPPGRAIHDRVPTRTSRHTTVTAPSRHTTVLPLQPVPQKKMPRPKARPPVPKLAFRLPKAVAPKRQLARILDDDSTLLDVLDNLLAKGVMLNADLILALANVDLVYIRLSALLCGAERILPHARRRSKTPATA
jgi:hypothetical protein